MSSFAPQTNARGTFVRGANDDFHELTAFIGSKLVDAEWGRETFVARSAAAGLLVKCLLVK